MKCVWCGKEYPAVDATENTPQVCSNVCRNLWDRAAAEVRHADELITSARAVPVVETQDSKT